MIRPIITALSPVIAVIAYHCRIIVIIIIRRIIGKHGRKYFAANTESGKAHIEEDQRRQIQQMVTE
eukprot:COSAG01_NODE_40864_length_458_cov_5.913649_1_plen_65_part_10